MMRKGIHNNWTDHCRPSCRHHPHDSCGSRRRKRKSSVIPKSSSSLGWRFLFIFFLFWLDLGGVVVVVVVVQAMVCHLEDEKGKRVELDSLYPPPPLDLLSGAPPPNADLSHLLVNEKDRGVHYAPDTNKLQCTLPNSCQQWKIQGCDLVICHGPHSCQDATMVENQGVACWANGACQNARLLGTHKVACGLDGNTRNTCRGTIMDVETSVLCFGPNSCAADQWRDHLTVAVGTKGVVQCHGSGFRALSCQNILVEVKQPYRACIKTDVKDTRSCAVVCREPQDCDETSIQFKVVRP